MKVIDPVEQVLLHGLGYGYARVQEGEDDTGLASVNPPSRIPATGRCAIRSSGTGYLGYILVWLVTRVKPISLALPDAPLLLGSRWDAALLYTIPIQTIESDMLWLITTGLLCSIVAIFEGKKKAQPSLRLCSYPDNGNSR